MNPIIYMMKSPQRWTMLRWWLRYSWYRRDLKKELC